MELIDKRSTNRIDQKVTTTKKNLENPEKYNHSPTNWLTDGEGLRKK